MELRGLHHVTAITGNAAENARFYTQVLGMRLVKKTVNQDDVSAYHFFYGDELGHPGTELTFFDWPHIEHAVYGPRTITHIGLRVNGRGALEWWTRRLQESGIAHSGIIEWDGRARLRFADPEGQRLELVDDGGAPGGTPWRKSPVPPEMGIRGLDSVTVVAERLDPTARFLTDVLCSRRRAEYVLDGGSSRRVVAFEVGANTLYVEERTDLKPGVTGIGGVHHVAFRTPDQDEQVSWRSRIVGGGIGVTPVIDRYYFRSIYFREPGHALFEIATDGPGFAMDEDPEHLGEMLALPPFLEPRRKEIEAALVPVGG